MQATRTGRRLVLGASLASAWGMDARANAIPFDRWLGELREEAIRKGVSAPVARAALTGFVPIPRIIELDRRQPEGTMSWAQYRDRVVAEPRIGNGRRAYDENRTLLAAIETRFGVSARTITAIWGIETNYGAMTGGFPVIQALATLAYDGRRSAFFRAELLEALKILDQGHIQPARMSGSWAGAMGQPQFMPSSFMELAIDFDGDGRRDIWDSRADALGSIGNFLRRRGNWRAGEPWGVEIKLPSGFDISAADGRTMRPLSAWAQLGVRSVDGNTMSGDRSAAIGAADGVNGQAFALFANAMAVRRYNPSTYYVQAVGLLSDLVGA